MFPAGNLPDCVCCSEKTRRHQRLPFSDSTRSKPEPPLVKGCGFALLVAPSRLCTDQSPVRHEPRSGGFFDGGIAQRAISEDLTKQSGCCSHDDGGLTDVGVAEGRKVPNSILRLKAGRSNRHSDSASAEKSPVDSNRVSSRRPRSIRSGCAGRRSCCASPFPAPSRNSETCLGVGPLHRL